MDEVSVTAMQKLRRERGASTPFHCAVCTFPCIALHFSAAAAAVAAEPSRLRAAYYSRYRPPSCHVWLAAGDSDCHCRCPGRIRD